MKKDKESELNQGIGYAQLGFTLMSDISTVILSFMLSLKIYDSMTKTLGFFNNNHIKLYSRLITLFIPLLTTGVFELIDIKAFGNEYSPWPKMNARYGHG